MSFKVKKLTVGKGKTVGDEKASEWIKRYYEVEISIEDEHDIEIAKASVEGLIDGWLSAEGLGIQGTPKPSSWNPSKIEWKEAEGSKGPYQRSEDVNNIDFKALVKDLASHNGKLTRSSYFYWLFQNGTTVGRKQRK